MEVVQLSDRVVLPLRGQKVEAGHLSEAELLIGISAIASSPSGFEEAVENIALLLERERGLSSLVVLEKRGGTVEPMARYGGRDVSAGRLLALPIREGAAEIGELRVAFRIQQSNQAQSPMLAAFVAEQIGALLARRRLSEKRADLKSGIDRLRRELAAVKVVSRAMGLLVQKRQLSERAARNWLELQSRKTGLSLHAVADRVITHHLTEPNPAANVADLASNDPAGFDLTRRRTA